MIVPLAFKVLLKLRFVSFLFLAFLKELLICLNSIENIASLLRLNCMLCDLNNIVKSLSPELVRFVIFDEPLLVHLIDKKWNSIVVEAGTTIP